MATMVAKLAVGMTGENLAAIAAKELDSGGGGGGGFECEVYHVFPFGLVK